MVNRKEMTRRSTWLTGNLRGPVFVIFIHKGTPERPPPLLPVPTVLGSLIHSKPPPNHTNSFRTGTGFGSRKPILDARWLARSQSCPLISPSRYKCSVPRASNSYEPSGTRCTALTRSCLHMCLGNKTLITSCKHLGCLVILHITEDAGLGILAGRPA